MPPFQTNYSLYQDPAVAGLIADSGFTDKVTGLAEGRANDGYFMALGSKQGAVKLPAAATDITNLQKCGGVVVRSLARMPSDDSLPAGYPIGEPVSIMRKGRIWVVVESAIVVGTSQVFVRYAGSGVLGAFTATSTGGETALLPDAVAKWVVGSSGAGLAQLEIDL